MIQYVESCDSTQDELSQCIQSVGAVFTLDQRKGRGRLGRSWLAAKHKTLAFSWRVPVHGLDLDKLPFISLLAGVALYQWMEKEFFSMLSSSTMQVLQSRLCLKWPNDLLFDGKKLAGILCEARLGLTDPQVLCGIGLNILPDPSLPSHSYSLIEILDDLDLKKQSQLLNESDLAVIFTEKLPRLIVHLEKLVKQLKEDQHLKNILVEWKKRTLPIGSKLSTQGYVGNFQGINDTGGLLLDIGEQIITIESGEVRLLLAE